MPEIKLSIQELHKRYGDHEVLKVVSLEARAGDVISIIGSSGSGKSTFCAALTFWKNPAKDRSPLITKIFIWCATTTASLRCLIKNSCSCYAPA